MTFRPLSLVLCPLVLTCQINAQNPITTAVGADWTFPGNGGKAEAAPLGRIFGVTADRNGVVYFSDADNQLVLSIDRAGIVKVVAGNGFAGFSGDGGLATNASLYTPKGLAVDDAGNIYIADTDNNRIRRVSVDDGTITTVAGTGEEGFSGDAGLAVRARLFSPGAVAIDKSNNLYISDTRNSRIRRVTADGIINTIAGTGQDAYSGDGRNAREAALNQPVGINFDAAGVLYVADTFNQRIRRIGPDGVISTFAGDGNPGFVDETDARTARFSFPKDITFDPAGNAYIVDPGNNVIRRIAPSGRISVFAGNTIRGFSGDDGPALRASFGNPVGITADRSGNVYVADVENQRVRKIDTNARASTFAGNGSFRVSPEGAPAIHTFLLLPYAIAVAPDGAMLIADSQHHRVVRVDEEGNVYTFAGTGVPGYSGDNGPATSATLNYPRGVAIDPAGDVYIADGSNLRIRKVLPDGRIITVAGNGTAGFSGDGGQATRAALNYPTSVATDSRGRVYIADQLNNRIRRINADGTIVTVAGTGVAGYSGDNGPADRSMLSQPFTVAVDANDDLYIADIYNHRIRFVGSDGRITTLAGSGKIGYDGDGGPATLASLNQPASVAVDASGTLYIAELGNHIIRRVTPEGLIDTVAGDGTPGYSGDGGPATKAKMFGPIAVAIDPIGNLFISDVFNHRVRTVLRSLPAAQASPETLSFSALSGGAQTAAQLISLSSELAGSPFSARLGGESPPSWLKVELTTGVAPASIPISVDPANLSAGAYEAVVSIITDSALPQQRDVRVVLDVKEAVIPKLAVTTPEMSFVVTEGERERTTQVMIMNQGSGTLNVVAEGSTEEGGSWLRPGRVTGVVSPSNPLAVSFTADPANLKPGIYKGELKISSAQGGAINLPVSLTVTALPQILRVSQTGLTFVGVTGDSAALPQSFSILNTGRGAMNWTASVVGGENWLSVTTPSGTTDASSAAVPIVRVQARTGSLTRGEFRGRIQVSAPGAQGSPAFIDVICNMMPPGSVLPPDIVPTGIVFTGVAGSSDPGSRSVDVLNFNNTDLDYTSSVFFPPGETAWFKYQPDRARVKTFSVQSFVVQPTLRGLTPGIHNGTINIAFRGVSRTLNLMMIVSGPGAADPSAGYPIRSTLTQECSAGDLIVLNTSLDAAVPVQAGFPARVEVGVFDQCGRAIDNGSVVASFNNGDSSIELVSLKNGTWTGTWIPSGVESSGVVVTIAAHEAGTELQGRNRTTIRVDR